MMHDRVGVKLPGPRISPATSDECVMKQLFPRVRKNEEKKQIVRSEDETAQSWESCHEDKKGSKDGDETEEDCKPAQQPGVSVDERPPCTSRPYTAHAQTRGPWPNSRRV